MCKVDVLWPNTSTDQVVFGISVTTYASYVAAEFMEQRSDMLVSRR